MFLPEQAWKLATDVLHSAGFGGMIILSLLALVFWLLLKALPMMKQIVVSQENTARSQEKTAECLQGIAVTFATHDQRAVIMYDQTGELDESITGVKSLITENHKELKDTLALNQKELMIAITKGAQS